MVCETLATGLVRLEAVQRFRERSCNLRTADDLTRGLEFSRERAIRKEIRIYRWVKYAESFRNIIAKRERQRPATPGEERAPLEWLRESRRREER